MENIKTPLGHVTMVPKGTYNSTTTYNRLDLVTYTDNNNLGVYVSKQDSLQNIPPSTTTAWMKLIDSNDTRGPQGDIGPTGPAGPAAGFGTITGIAEPLNSSDNPTIEIEPLNYDNTAKSFKFKFGIPVGRQGAQGPTGPTGNALVINPIQFELKGDQMKFGLFENGNDANVELRTAYSGNQVGITISQYTQGFSQSQRTLTLLNSQGNTSIPGNLTIAGDLNLNKPLSVESGGTNINSNPSMIINLSSTQAANVFNTNPQPGVTGILPIAQGGTGASTSTQARINLGITPANIGALSLEGGSLTGDFTLKNGKHLYFESVTTNGLQQALIYLRGVNESYGNNISIWYFQPKSNPHGAQLYQFPEYDNTLTADTNYYYKVLTSKNPVTIAQGGTGASTSTQARINLGITPANIGAMSLNGGILGINAQIISTSSWSCQYYRGRDYAPFVIKNNPGDDNYYPAISMKAKSSSWEIGTYTANDYLEFVNISDANHSTSTNTATGTFVIKPNGKILNFLSLESSGEAVMKTFNTGITLGTAPSATTWIGGFAIFGKDNYNNTAYFESSYGTSRTVTTRLLSRNKIDGNGDYINNYLELNVTNAGNKQIYVSAPEAWRTALGGICARPNYTSGTTELTPGTSSLSTGQLYFVYE